MVEATAPLKPFTTIQYQTKDGEKISATKNNGVVTLVGDKNGTRQMPLDDFMKNELPNAVPLEKTPEKDTVEISKPADTDKKAGYALKPETAADLGIPPEIKAEQDKRIAEILKEKGKIDPTKDKVFYNAQTGELDTIKPGLIMENKPQAAQKIDVVA